MIMMNFKFLFLDSLYFNIRGIDIMDVNYFQHFRKFENLFWILFDPKIF